MNREQQRYLQKQGQMDDEGNPIAPALIAPAPHRPNGWSREYVGEVRSELRVSPGRPVRGDQLHDRGGHHPAVLTALIALMDWAFGSAIFELLRRRQLMSDDRHRRGDTRSRPTRPRGR